MAQATFPTPFKTFRNAFQGLLLKTQPYFELIQVGWQTAWFGSSHCSLALTDSPALTGGGGCGRRGNAAGGGRTGFGGGRLFAWWPEGEAENGEVRMSHLSPLTRQGLKCPCGCKRDIS